MLSAQNRFLTLPVSALALMTLVLSAERVRAGAPAPVIDVHVHAALAASEGPPPMAMCTPLTPPAWDPARPYEETFLAALKNPQCDDPIWSPETDVEVMERTIAEVERHNVFGVLGGSPEHVATWRAAAPGRFYSGLDFRIGRDDHTPETLRDLAADDRLDVFAEISNQYAGIAPDDERMDPYWAVAEELDIPVGIHIGPGPPGVHHLGLTGYRASLHSALTLENVLVKHPRLRVYIMHAGFPMLDDVLALMYTHPQVYVGTGVIVYTQTPAAFYRYLKALVDGGFANRIMFGSDQMVWPETIGRSINIINSAPFLSAEQKRDILYNNAARFLRLSETEIARHHEAP